MFFFSFRYKRRRSKDGLDMTVGEPAKLIILYSVPLLIGNLFQQMYSMVDTIIVGRLLGTDALAAVGTTGPMNFLVLGFCYGISSGFAVIAAQRFGAKDFAGLKRSVAMNIILNGFFAVLITILACSTALPVLHLINTPEEIINDSWRYIFIIYLGVFSMMLYNGTACILRAIGDSSSPLMFLVFSSVLNIFLDIVLIVRGHMGVAGAALATVISQFSAGTAAFIWIVVRYPILHVSRSDFMWDTAFAVRHLAIGLNMAFQFSITAIGAVILQGALNVFGAVKIAAFTAAQKVEQMITVAAETIGVTMANYSGQNYGAGRVDRIREGTNKACLITVGFSLISAVIALTLSDKLTGLFVSGDQPEVLASARICLQIGSVFFPALFVLFIYRNVLQSIGRGFWPLMGGIFELLARLLAAWILPGLWGYTGICAADPLAWISAALPLGIAYYIIMSDFKVETPFL